MEQREKIQKFAQKNVGGVRSKNLFFENEIVPEYITTRIAAGLLGISENALRIKVCRGQVPVHKLGRSLRFRMSEIACLFKPRE